MFLNPNLNWQDKNGKTTVMRLMETQNFIYFNEFVNFSKNEIDFLVKDKDGCSISEYFFGGNGLKKINEIVLSVENKDIFFNIFKLDSIMEITLKMLDEYLKNEERTKNNNYSVFLFCNNFEKIFSSLENSVVKSLTEKLIEKNKKIKKIADKLYLEVELGEKNKNFVKKIKI